MTSPENPCPNGCSAYDYTGYCECKSGAFIEWDKHGDPDAPSSWKPAPSKIESIFPNEPSAENKPEPSKELETLPPMTEAFF